MQQAKILLLAFSVWSCWVTAALAEGDGPCPELPKTLLRKLLYDEPYYLLEELGKASDDDTALTRTFLSPAHIQAATLLETWMSQAGMRTWRDNVANVHGRADGSIDNATEIIIGSHYDTVIDGGKYDGALGIIVGIAAVKARMVQMAACKGYATWQQLEALTVEPILDLRQLLGHKVLALLPQPLHIIGFSDEEGVRFQSTFLGSKAVAGQLGGILEMEDASGITIREALELHGYSLLEDSLQAMKLPVDKVKAYFEVHIEQGPILESLNEPVGVVAGIAGQTRLYAVVKGEQGHAGTVPMTLRKDPMVVAARVIAKLEDICHEILANDTSSNLVCTAGAIYVYPNAGNVIPRYANFTLDIRGRYDESRKQVVRDITTFMKQLCDARGLTCVMDLKHQADAIHSEASLTKDLLVATTNAKVLAELINSSVDNLTMHASTQVYPTINEHGYCSAANLQACHDKATVSPPVLVSGAGHDAMVLANITKMAMLFVRCREGLSHSSKEFASKADVGMGTLSLYLCLRGNP